MNAFKKILYVDDDEDYREMFSDAIKEADPNANVVCAVNGVEALTYLNTNLEKNDLPCLIVLDLNMPFLNGRETFKKIKGNPALENVPIIILTSSENPNDKNLFENLGIEIITKPDNYHYLNAIASRLLSRCH